MEPTRSIDSPTTQTETEFSQSIQEKINELKEAYGRSYFDKDGKLAAKVDEEVRGWLGKISDDNILLSLEGQIRDVESYRDIDPNGPLKSKLDVSNTDGEEANSVVNPIKKDNVVEMLKRDAGTEHQVEVQPEPQSINPKENTQNDIDTKGITDLPGLQTYSINKIGAGLNFTEKGWRDDFTPEQKQNFISEMIKEIDNAHQNPNETQAVSSIGNNEQSVPIEPEPVINQETQDNQPQNLNNPPVVADNVQNVPNVASQNQPGEPAQAVETPWSEESTRSRISELRKQIYDLEKKSTGNLQINNPAVLEPLKKELSDKVNDIADFVTENFLKSKGILSEEQFDSLPGDQKSALKLEINTLLLEKVARPQISELRALEKADKKKSKALEKAGEYGSVVLEAARKLTSTNTMKWYMGLDWRIRLGGTSALVGLVGLGAGLGLGIVGAKVGMRVGRGVAAWAAGGIAKEGFNDKIDELTKKKEKEVKSIETSALTGEEKIQKIKNIEDEYDKRIRRWKIAKAAVVAGATAGTATLLSGLGEDMFNDVGGSSKGFVVEAENNPKGDPDLIRVKTKIPDSSPDYIKNQNFEVEPNTEIEPFSFSTEEMEHMPVKGDNNWNLLKETLEHEDRFKNLKPGQKSYVLSHLNNYTIKNHEMFGLDKEGGVSIGKEVNYSKLFEDKKFVESLMKEAEGLTPAKIARIETNDAKILEWVRDNPGRKLDSEAFKEINSIKPKFTAILPENKYKFLEKDSGAAMVDAEDWQNEMNPGGGKEELLPKPEDASEDDLEKMKQAAEKAMEEAEESGKRMEDTLQKYKTPEPLPDVPPAPKYTVPNFDQKPQEMHYAGVAGVAAAMGAAKMSGFGSEVVEELRQAKSQIHTSEQQNSRVEAVRTMTGDKHSAEVAIISNEELERGVFESIDMVYGEKRLGGLLGKTPGVNSKEWKQIAGRKAHQVMAYFLPKDEAERQSLPQDLVNILGSSEKHRRFVEGMIKMKNDIYEFSGRKIDLIPNLQETVPEYLKRLGRYHMDMILEQRKNSQTNELPKAA